MAAAVFTVTIYAPNHSDIGKKRRDHYLETGQVLQEPGTGQNKAGSMWKNMDNDIKENNKRYQIVELFTCQLVCSDL